MNWIEEEDGFYVATVQRASLECLAEWLRKLCLVDGSIEGCNYLWVEVRDGSLQAVARYADEFGRFCVNLDLEETIRRVEELWAMGDEDLADELQEQEELELAREIHRAAQEVFAGRDLELRIFSADEDTPMMVCRVS